MNLQGELAISIGVIAMFLLLGPALTTIPMMAKEIGGIRWKRGQRMGYLTLGLIAIHLFVLGIKGWLIPNSWHGGMPPISLVALVIALIPLFVKRKKKHEKLMRDKKREEASEYKRNGS